MLEVFSLCKQKEKDQGMHSSSNGGLMAKALPRDDMLERVSKNGMALVHADEELKGDREIIMEAVSNNGLALEYATEELKGDREIVMRAVSKDGFALRLASQELKGDKEMMQHALRPRPGQGDLIGLKVVLLSGRCCDEIFFHVNTKRYVLRRCAELLDLDPAHVERSGALMCGAVEVQERQAPNRTRIFWWRLRVKARPRRFDSAANLRKDFKL